MDEVATPAAAAAASTRSVADDVVGGELGRLEPADLRMELDQRVGAARTCPPSRRRGEVGLDDADVRMQLGQDRGVGADACRSPRCR